MARGLAWHGSVHGGVLAWQGGHAWQGACMVVGGHA